MTLNELLNGYNVDVTVNLKITEKEYRRKPTRSEVREVEDLLEDLRAFPYTFLNNAAKLTKTLMITVSP